MRFLYLIFLSVTLLFGSLQAQVNVTITDILPAKFAETLERDTHAGGADVKVSVKGSRTGLFQLRNGETSLALVMLQPGEQPPAGDFVSIVVAYQTAVAVAASALPLTQMTFEQLDSIFCEDAPSSIKRWGDLGAPGLWTGRPIQPMMSGPSSGLSFDLFRHTVMRSVNVKIGLPILATNEEVTSKMLSSDASGLAIMPALPKNSPFKALLIAKNAQSIAYAPTPEAIHSGNYPIRMPIYMIFKKADSKKLFGISRFLLSEECAEAWENANLVPLPVQARNKQILDLEVL